MTDKIQILIVDDRPENLISLTAILDRPDYDLVMVNSGKAALRALLERDFALILMDVQMPIMDGFETVSLIKAREKTKRVPIIFLTALSKDEPFVFRGYDAGAVDYITKPIDPRILRSKVAVFAELHLQKLEIVRQAALLRASERKELEQERALMELESLRREQFLLKKYRDLVEGIHHGVVWTLDAKTLTPNFVGPQFENLTGIKPGSLSTETAKALTLFPEEDMLKIRECLRRCAAGEGDFVIEHRVRREDGEALWFQSSGRLADSGVSGQDKEIRGVSFDITHLKLAEELARRSTRLRDDFLSIASHELKTPLTPLKLQVQLFKRLSLTPGEEESFPRERTQRMVGTIERQVDRLIKLVDELLDVSKINNGKLIIQRESVNLGDLINDVTLRFSGELSQAGCTVNLDLHPRVLGWWDRLRIEQVFINLLTNALKYGAGKPIDIRLREEHGMATLEVRDRGIGIHEADLQRIFQRFERAVSNMNFGGLGLGLYIVKEIVVAHDGDVQVESEEGEGSKFIIRLPASSERTQVPGLNLTSPLEGDLAISSLKGHLSGPKPQAR